MNFLWPSFLHMMKNPPSAEVLLNLARYKFLFGKAEVNHAPVSLVFYVTKRCNYKCEFCFTYSDLNKPEWEKFELTPIRLRELLETDFGRKALRIGFLGGEPFLNDHLEELLKISHEKGKITTVVTNASLVDQQRLQKLCEHYPTMLGISLYDNNSKEVSFLARELAKRKKFFWVQSVVDALHLEAMLDKIEFAHQNNIQNLILSNYHPEHSGQYNKVIYADDLRFKNMAEAATSLAQKYGIKLTLPNPIDRQYKTRSCKMPYSYLHVDSEGNIGPCCMRSPKKDYGNLARNSDWNGEYFLNLRESFTDFSREPVTDCRYCENFGRDLYDV